MRAGGTVLVRRLQHIMRSYSGQVPEVMQHLPAYVDILSPSVSLRCQRAFCELPLRPWRLTSPK